MFWTGPGTALSQPSNIGTWDVSTITDMSYMFYNATNFNDPIGAWDVSNVKYFTGMFEGARLFNQPLDTWQTSSAVWLGGMFAGASSFNQPLNSWTTDSVVGLREMFKWDTSFNQPLDNWNTSNVVYFDGVFAGASHFNQPLGAWNTNKAGSMASMFNGATTFNQALDMWDVSRVKDMDRMFEDAVSFNQPLAAWDVGKLEDAKAMFKNAKLFNQPLSSWNTALVDNMQEMFFGANDFNQPLGSWPLAAYVLLSNMLDSSGLDCTNYSATLDGWAKQNACPSNRYFSASGLHYAPSVIQERAYLANLKQWTISGDTLASGSCCFLDTTTTSEFACFTFNFNNQSLTHTGVYYDTFASSYGCDSFAALNLLIDTIADLQVTQAGPLLNSVNLVNNHQWVRCNPFGFIPGATTASYTAPSNGEYAVIIAGEFCQDTSVCISVTNAAHQDVTSPEFLISTIVDQRLILLIATHSLLDVEVSIWSCTGQKLLVAHPGNVQRASIDCSYFTPGHYLVAISDGDKRYCKNILLE
jgi:hypothetical protein